jgi:OmpA-OmpF porin, OOP family
MRKVFIGFLIFAGLITNAQNPGDYCTLTLVLKDQTGAVLPGQKFKMLDSGSKLVAELITNTEGKSVIKLLKNTKYFFESLIAGKTMKTEIPIESDDKFILELQLGNSPSEVKEDVKVILHVTDDKGIPETEAKLQIKDGTEVVFTCVTDVDGLCNVQLKRGKGYIFVIDKFGKTFNLALDIPNDPDLAEFSYNLKIKVVEKYMRSFVLDNVYFDYNKSNIKPESYPSLNQLYDMMKSNDAVTIEVDGHTDSDGDDPSNMRLSQRRADAVKQYVVSKGINETRITTKGYGETVPIASNETDAGRAKNRRTEIKVITE